MAQNADRTLAMSAMQNVNAHQDSGMAVKTNLGTAWIHAAPCDTCIKDIRSRRSCYLKVSRWTVTACKQETECKCMFAGQLACHHRELYPGHGHVSCTRVYVVLWSRTSGKCSGSFRLHDRLTWGCRSFVY